MRYPGYVDTTIYEKVTSYVSGSLTHTMTTVSDGLVNGAIYNFKWKAVNNFGSSEYSEDVSVAVVAKPIASTSIDKVLELSTENSISVTWNSVAAGVSPGGLITGYVLTVKDCMNGTLWNAFNGLDLGVPSQTKFTALGLTTGREYKFTVTAYNYNGAGLSSAEYSYSACVKASGFAAPRRKTSTKTTITVEWDEPEKNGGCEIIGYAVFMNDGTLLGTTYTEVNMVNDPAVRSRPGLHEHTITTFGGTDYGKDYKIYVKVYTSEGEVSSDYVSITLGDVPDAPPSPPTHLTSSSTAHKLVLSYPALASTLNGGSTILSYSLEWDPTGTTGSFVPLIGSTVNSLATQITIQQGIVKGKSYRFRYRALNKYGWGEYSEIATVIAGQAPSKPAAPQFDSATNTEINLVLNLLVDNGGLPITSYTLEIKNENDPLDVFNPVASYDNQSPSIKLDQATTDSFLVTGRIYLFRFTATNSRGTSEPSDVIKVALTNVPGIPQNLRRLETGSTKTSIAMTWDPVADGTTPGGLITGYKLYMANGTISGYQLIYDGTGLPTITTKIISNLETGETYRFKVLALNYNGESALSSELLTQSCIKPTGFSAPTRVSSTSTTLNLAWLPPSDDGGCPILSYVVYRDNGDGSSVTNEVNSNADANVRNKPTLLGMLITYYPSSPSGLPFTYKVVASNSIGDTDSDTSTFILAGIPAAPLVAPTNTSQSSTSISLSYNALTTTLETGGAPILSYNLQMDDGLGGAFTDLYGVTADTLITSYTVYGLVKGRVYAFRYRARNIYGWNSDYSPIFRLRAADLPTAPPEPTLYTATANSITLTLQPCPDDGGSIIYGYELFMNTGTDGSAFS